MIGKGSLKEGLYVLDNGLINASINNISLQQWHQRFGHPSNKKLKLLSHELSSHDKHVCLICPLAKQTRLT